MQDKMAPKCTVLQRKTQAPHALLHLPLGIAPNQKGWSEQHFRKYHSDSGPCVVTTALLHVEVKEFLAMIQKKPHDCFALGSPVKRVYIQTHPIESRKFFVEDFLSLFAKQHRHWWSHPPVLAPGIVGQCGVLQVLWESKFLLRDAQMSSIGRKRNTENVSVRLCGQMEAMHSPMWSVAGLLDVTPNGTERSSVGVKRRKVVAQASAEREMSQAGPRRSRTCLCRRAEGARECGEVGRGYTKPEGRWSWPPGSGTRRVRVAKAARECGTLENARGELHRTQKSEI
ncbi:hypothetical protein EDB83DRAFT_2319812 [Lactarius deliciosus]|nr:hypothetical protein EDB83DRAFT_2319812 [Lactarius deliciosus]